MFEADFALKGFGDEVNFLNIFIKNIFLDLIRDENNFLYLPPIRLTALTIGKTKPSKLIILKNCFYFIFKNKK